VLRHREQYQAIADDAEKSEYFVKVEWLDTLPRDKAFHEIGLFGNQNSVCQPVAASWRHTVERLKTVFPNWDAKRRKTDCPDKETEVSL
jgi:hypothetical protein